MIDSNVFPDGNTENFTYKEKISHSLLEARLLRRYSAEFMIKMIESLNDYKEKNGGDIILDILFAKYLIHANTEDLIKAVQALSEKGEFKSQFHYGLALLCPIDEFKYLRNKIFIQSWRLSSSDIFILD